MLIRKNKKFIAVMVWLIIIVLLFSVVAIVALYTSPQPSFQIPADNIEALINNEGSNGVIQGETFTVWENTIDTEEVDTDAIEWEEDIELVPQEVDAAQEEVADDDTV